MNKKSNRIKILYGLEASDAGALKHLKYLALNVRKDIFEIFVIISTERSKRVFKDIEELKKAGVFVVIIEMSREINFLKDSIAFVKILCNIFKERYDIVHAHSSKAGFLFRIASWLAMTPKIVYTPHCFYFQGQIGIKKSVYIFLEKMLGLLTDFVIVSGNEKKSAIDYSLYKRGKIIHINNAIKHSNYQLYVEKDFIKRSLQLSNASVIIGGLGRLTKQKGWPTFLVAAKQVVDRIPNAFFLIVGDGDMHDELIHEIKTLGLKENVKLIGHCDDINKIYSVIDIFISTSNWEGLPYVILEAMLFKKPIIATALGYADIIVESENGYLFPKDDYNSLSDIILKVASARSLWSNLGGRSFQILKSNCSFEYFINRHEKLYLTEPSMRHVK